MNTYQEINFDGLVGPTHHFGGLSEDNMASDSNRDAISNPQKAALQGLEKMKTLHDAGHPQAVLPPLPRPFLESLYALGIGSKTTPPQHTLRRAFEISPHLLSAVSSASSMWTANAATTAPSCDTLDGTLHLVTANLESKLHRSLEAPATFRNLLQIFGSRTVKPALPGGQAMGDEGAANHTRLSTDHGAKGIHVFVYGRDGISDKLAGERFIGRQTLLASQSVARLLKLDPDQVVFIRQNQQVIDAGVFHNDVIAVGNLDCYFSHEKAYAEGEYALKAISEKFERITDSKLIHIVVPNAVISVDRAVKTYLFNSQLIGPSGNMTLIAPQECKEDPVVFEYLQSLCDDTHTPIQKVKYFNLRESMRNGGGPACLRLRIVMNEQEKQKIGPRILFDDALYSDLTKWVKKHYRTSLALSDFLSPELLESFELAYSELSDILRLNW